MAIFAVIITKGVESIRARIETECQAWHQLTDDVFLVSYKGATTQELAEALGIRKGETGSGVTIPVTNYSGRADPNVWEWLRANWPEQV